jgi:hypothetical protein
MDTEPENHSSNPRYRRVLKVLAKAPRGRDVNALLSRRFSLETIADLVRIGFAMIHLESTARRGQTIEVARVRLTDVGRMAIEGPNRFTEH